MNQEDYCIQLITTRQIDPNGTLNFWEPRYKTMTVAAELGAVGAIHPGFHAVLDNPVPIQANNNPIRRLSQMLPRKNHGEQLIACVDIKMIYYTINVTERKS